MYKLIFYPLTLMLHNEYISIQPPLLDMQSPSSLQQENLIATTGNVVPVHTTPIFQQTYPCFRTTPLSWSGPQVSAPAPTIPDNASLIRKFADAITSKKNDPLPK